MFCMIDWSYGLYLWIIYEWKRKLNDNMRVSRMSVLMQLSAVSRRSLIRQVTMVLRLAVTMVTVTKATVEGVCTNSAYSWTTRVRRATTYAASTELRAWPRDVGLDLGWPVDVRAIWNSLPLDIRNSCSIASFRRQLKTFLFSTSGHL